MIFGLFLCFYIQCARQRSKLPSSCFIRGVCILVMRLTFVQGSMLFHRRTVLILYMKLYPSAQSISSRSFPQQNE